MAKAAGDLTNLRKALKVTRWNPVKTNGNGYKFPSRINHANTAGQAAELRIMMGQKLNKNNCLPVAAKTTSTSPEVQTGIHPASCVK